MLIIITIIAITLIILTLKKRNKKKVLVQATKYKQHSKFKAFPKQATITKLYK